MKKLYKVTIECDSFFVSDETDEIALNELAAKYVAEDYGINLSRYDPHDRPIVKISEITSSSQISARWKNGKYLLWGAKDDITPHQWLLKAFL